jgi:GT2 family glycosyltransferase
MTPRLYFLLPVYNESKSIYDLLEEINVFSKESAYPIHAFPINDASVDDSKEWIEKANKPLKIFSSRI